jgi:heme A synthase
MSPYIVHAHTYTDVPTCTQNHPCSFRVVNSILKNNLSSLNILVKLEHLLESARVCVCVITHMYVSLPTCIFALC